MTGLASIVDDFVSAKRVVVTSSTNNGSTSFALFLANTILSEDKVVLLYNPTRDIDRGFVKTYYPRVYDNVIWMHSPLDSFLEYLQESTFNFDCLIVDPGDCLMVNPEIVRTIGSLRRKGSTVIFTSQIRQDPHKGWAPYSTIERVNSFDYSIWITKVTEAGGMFKKKWVDVHKEIRSGTNFIARYVAMFTDEGNIVG